MKKMTKQVKGFVGVVAVLLAVILVLGITLGVAIKQKKDLEKGTGTLYTGGMILEETEQGDKYGLSLVSETIPEDQYEEYGISPLAQTALSVKVKIEGENTDALKVKWTIAWENGTSGKWGYQKDTGDYVTGSASSDTHTYNLSCTEAFGETMILKAQLEADATKTATRKIQYRQGFASLSGTLGASYGTSKNFSWTLSGKETETVAFPGDALNATEFLSGNSGGTSTVKVGLSTVYTVAATVTEMKIEVAPTEAYITALTAACGGTAQGNVAGTASVYKALGAVTAGSDQTQGNGTLKATDVLFIDPAASKLDFTALKSGLKALGAVDLINVRLSVKVNGQLQQKVIALRFDASSFGTIYTGFGWTDDGSDLVFGG